MIPLRDTIPAVKFPFVTIALILINILVFLYEVSLGEKTNQFVASLGMIPERYFYLTEHQWINVPGRFVPFVTSIFLHGGWLHLIGNVWFLWIFGDNVEDRLGHGRYFIIYILMGVTAGFIHAYMNPSSAIPVVGASGAIAGVMGTYFIYFPRARILTLIPIFIFLHFVELPAFLFLGIWLLFQILSSKLTDASQGGVAWFAHIGGFVSGILIAFIYFGKRPKARYVK